jgi:hypothetical protein
MRASESSRKRARLASHPNFNAFHAAPGPARRVLRSPALEAIVMNVPEQALRQERVLVAAEAGSAPTAWTAQCRQLPDDALVIAQQPDERPDTFARRALQRIARLGENGWCPSKAVIAVAPTPPRDTADARALVARALVHSLRNVEGAELVIAGDAGFPAAQRHELFSLAQELMQMAFGTTLSIRVQFSELPVRCSKRAAGRPHAYSARNATLPMRMVANS